MPVTFKRLAAVGLAAREDGFTMIVTLGVMLVTSVLLVGAFAVANGDIHLSRADNTQKQAYYAALAGVQAYEQKLQANPNYWETCEGPTGTVLEGASERYEVKVLPASTAPGGTTECSAANPFATVIEGGASGALANTFRIKSTGYVKTTGYSGSAKRSLVATFQVTGFLNYLYFTNFEQGDPQVFGTSKECEGKYHSEWSGKGLNCAEIQFTSGDEVNGPMHTNDAAKVVGEASFGRNEHSPIDVVEMNGGTYPTEGCGEGSAKYYTATKCFTKGATLEPPESDTSLESYVNEADRFEGQVHLELKGNTGQIAVTRFNGEGKEVKETIAWPANGLIYVKQSAAGCNYTYEVANSDTGSTNEAEKNCGNVYVNGTYAKSLTVAGEQEVVINGSLYPTSVEGKLGEKPSGTATLGLIATKYVRVYHPCEGGRGGGNGGGSLETPWIYAAVLSTAHSFIVDNYACGAELGKLHVYGAIAQDYRGAVGTTGGTGYIKDYKYDDRLAAAEPPYFLAPLKAGWKIARQTAPEPG